MLEIKIKDNSLGLRIFVNGIPNIKDIGAEQLNIIVEALEKHIDDEFRKRKHSKKETEIPL